MNHIVSRELQVRLSVPTKCARRASMRFLRKRIRLTQRAKADIKKEAESTAQNMALSADNAAEILDKVDPVSSESLIPPKTVNSASLKNCCKRKQSSVSPTSFVNKTNWAINLSSRPLILAKLKCPY